MEYKLLVSATTGAMNTLLSKLAQMLTNEYKLQKAVKKDIEHLQKELEGMHGALEKVSMVPTDQLDNQVRIWAKEVRVLSYDIEDGSKSSLVSSKPCSRQPRLAMVGIDGSRDELVGFITQEDDPPNMQIKVVSIVGFGGLGKTTLANAVYNRFEGKLFDARAFVSVSLKPDINKILKNILSQLDRQIYYQINEAWDEKPLIDEIRTFLGDKRYFNFQSMVGVLLIILPPS